MGEKELQLCHRCPPPPSATPLDALGELFVDDLHLSLVELGGLLLQRLAPTGSTPGIFDLVVLLELRIFL